MCRASGQEGQKGWAGEPLRKRLGSACRAGSVLVASHFPALEMGNQSGVQTKRAIGVDVPTHLGLDQACGSHRADLQVHAGHTNLLRLKALGLRLGSAFRAGVLHSPGCGRAM